MMPPLHIRRGAEHLVALGPRGLAEFLAEVGAATGNEAAIADALACWRRLDPAMVRGVLAHHADGRQFPSAVVAVERDE